MKKFILVVVFSSFGLVAFAADTPKVEEMLVTISQANVCYKASGIESKERGLLIQGISVQVPCNDKPAVALPVVKMEKVDQKCGYVVGKFPNYSPMHQFNNHFNFTLIARCPTDEK